VFRAPWPIKLDLRPGQMPEASRAPRARKPVLNLPVVQIAEHAVGRRPAYLPLER